MNRREFIVGLGLAGLLGCAKPAQFTDLSGRMYTASPSGQVGYQEFVLKGQCYDRAQLADEISELAGVVLVRETDGFKDTYTGVFKDNHGTHDLKLSVVSTDLAGGGVDYQAINSVHLESNCPSKLEDLGQKLASLFNKDHCYRD